MCLNVLESSPFYTRSDAHTQKILPGSSRSNGKSKHVMPTASIGIRSDISDNFSICLPLARAGD